MEGTRRSGDGGNGAVGGWRREWGGEWGGKWGGNILTVFQTIDYVQISIFIK